MKFLLIKPGERKNLNQFIITAPSNQPPLSLLYLGAVLEKEGHKVEILDYYMENVSMEKLKNSLNSSDAVGMTIYTYDCKSAQDISKNIKDLDSEIPLIIGGPHCIFYQKKSLQDFPYADISIVGEGEQGILDLANSFQGKKNLFDINGIYYRDNGLIKPGKPIQAIEKLDDLPFPARHLVDKYDYGDFPFGYQLKKKVTSVITSRDCPFRCRFCSIYSNFRRDLSFRQCSAEYVVKEIQELDRKYRSVWIADDSFIADNKRAHKIFDMLLDSCTDLEFLIRGTRVDSADRELYMKMKKTGVKYIEFGLESGNQDVLDFYNKEITLKQIREAVNLAKEMGFFISANFILGAPIETKQHIEKTINYACSLPLDIAFFVPLRYVMGSQLWNEAVENNKISRDTFAIFADSNKGLGNFSREELTTYTNQAYKTFYFRSSYLIGQIYRSLLRKDFSLLFNGWKFLSLLTNSKIN
jgi:anaerobic magnesium-protoporphyrin IX monomethyl ester cyclase